MIDNYCLSQSITKSLLNDIPLRNANLHYIGLHATDIIFHEMDFFKNYKSTNPICCTTSFQDEN